MPEVEEDAIILGMEDDIDVHEAQTASVDEQIPLTEFNIKLKSLSHGHGQCMTSMAPNITRNHKPQDSRAPTGQSVDHPPASLLKITLDHPGQTTGKVINNTAGRPYSLDDQSEAGTRGFSPNDSKYNQQDDGGSRPHRGMGFCIQCKRKKAAVMCTCGQVRICREYSAACQNCRLVMDKMQQSRY